jgi:hypothetical protein
VEQREYLPAFAVVEVLGYDADAGTTIDTAIDPLYLAAPRKIFWLKEAAETEAARLNEANSNRPIHYLVRSTLVELVAGDPRFDGVQQGAAYITALDDDEMTEGQPRYDCHWEWGGRVVVLTDGFNAIDDALDWARRRALSVTVQLHHSDHYDAGSSINEDLPRWPPPDWQGP